MKEFTYLGRQFYRNGRPHQIFSGAIHYFRVYPTSWKDRLLKLKNCGFNTVETYICWSLHEREEGKFDFSGGLDLGAFIDTAAQLGLDVILRPGPYICAETDFGGLPSWLLSYPDIELRCDNAIYMEKIERYIQAISEIIRPRLVTHGGNIIMLQVENEYGSYGNDKGYQEKLCKLYRANGLDCMLFTADGAETVMLKNGSIDGLLTALTFGAEPMKNMKILQNRTDQPLFCAEYWNGWYDVWGKDHYSRSVNEVAEDVRQFLSLGASFNFYMFCGGTNFGMINGANIASETDHSYWFQTTSYDYCAPLTEAGDMTEKYYLLKELIESYTGERHSLPVQDSVKRAYASLTADGYAPLLDSLDGRASVHSALPLTFERLGVDFGYVLYTTYTEVVEDGEFWIRGLRDRAVVLVNGKLRGTQEHGVNLPRLQLKASDGYARIDILVENRGRCNYSWQLKDPKGILSGVVYQAKFLMGFDHIPLRADTIGKISFRPLEQGEADGPAFYHFSMYLAEEPSDTFLYPQGFQNGCVYINGINIGRYCNLYKPQRTLYVPAGVLRRGENEIVLFETDGSVHPTIGFSDRPIYWETETMQEKVEN